MQSWVDGILNWVQNPAVSAAMVDIVIKSFVVLTLAGLICLATRRASASLRHTVWFVAVASVLVLPFLGPLLPAWKRPLWRVAAAAHDGGQVSVAIDIIPIPMSVWFHPTPRKAGSAAADSPRENFGSRPSLGIRFRSGWTPWLAGLWLGAAVCLLAWLALGRVRLRALRRESVPPPGSEWTALLRQCCGQLNIRRKVELRFSTVRLIPMTWGSWRPIIVLPAEADAWSPERRTVVLLHELGHVKRWDCLTQTVTRVACALYWFNPLIWLAAGRMCVEREAACDDLVLNCGCKASDYAGHLVDLAQHLTPTPGVASIAMARSTRLEKRVKAILDALRVRRSPRAVWVGLFCVAVLGLVGTLAAQKPAAESSAALPDAAAAGALPWYDARLRAFFAAKETQARKLAGSGTQTIDPEVWAYFDAGSAGDWSRAQTLIGQLHPNVAHDELPPGAICKTILWQPALETLIALDEFSAWKEKDVLAFSDEIIKSIPRGSIYFGGTDPGRGVITAMSESHVKGDPFFTLTQNALVDSNYLDYARQMYGSKIRVPTDQDRANAIHQYREEREKRREAHKLFPGEEPDDQPGQELPNNHMSVMLVNGFLSKLVFEQNPDREFYVEESFPLEWMYPHLAPNGLIMRIHRQALTEIPEDALRKDHEYWSKFLKPRIGDWLKAETPPTEVVAYSESVFLKKDFGNFSGNRQFVEDLRARQAFSKLRSAIAGVYAWRLGGQCPPGLRPKSKSETERLRQEADFAFRQAVALCPTSPEAVFRYVNFLIQFNRMDDAIVVTASCQKLDPSNIQVKSLVSNLRQFAEQRGKRP